MLIVLSQQISTGVFSGNSTPPRLLGKYDDLKPAVESCEQHLSAVAPFIGSSVCKIWILQLEDGQCVYQDEIPRPVDQFSEADLLKMFDHIP